MDRLLQDTRYAFRTFLRQPTLTLTALGALALGIGANTAVFSVVYAVLLKPLPFADPDRLVVVWETNEIRGVPLMAAAPPNLDDWRRQAQTFADMGAFARASLTLDADTEAEAEQLEAGRVTGTLFDLLGVRPALGRAFTPADERAASPPTVILSDGLWRRRFGADPSMVGRTLRLGGRSVEVIGIMPAGLQFPPPIAFEAITLPDPADIWIPLREKEFSYQRGAHFLTTIARLKPGATVTSAREEMGVIAARLAAQYPDSNAGWGATVVPLVDEITGDTRPALLVLLAAVGLVLLLACANVAHLLLARSIDRRREIAVRSALGAGRRRLARQLFTESLALALAGGGLGVLLGAWGVRLITRLGPTSVPRLDEVAIDWRAVAVAFACAIAAAVLAGSAPILSAARQHALDGLRERSATGGPGTRRVQTVLIAGEAALAVVVVVVAVLLGESFLRLRGVDPGFRPDRVLSFRVTLPGTRYTADARATFLEQALNRLRALPGVEAAGTIDSLPLGDNRQGTYFTIEGAPALPDGTSPQMHISIAGPGYFEAMGFRILEGRTFEMRDRVGAEPVVIVNETLARQHFPGTSPVGRFIRVGMNTQTARKIIGVVNDEHHDSLSVTTAAGAYMPALQFSWGAHAFVLRTAARPETLADAARRTIRDLDPTLAVFGLTTMEQVVEASVAAPRFATLLLTLFAFVALALAGVGVYGVTSHSVSARTAEIGVRMALGAGAGDIMRTLLGRSLAVAAIGIGIGLMGAVGLSRMLETMLFGVTATTPHVYGTAAVIVTAAATLACWIPARRAMTVDPNIVLRSE
jgi:putative ABC transport system permease protein